MNRADLAAIVARVRIAADVLEGADANEECLDVATMLETAATDLRGLVTR